MKKLLLTLIAVGLLGWTGIVSATTINLSNGKADFTIVDGVVVNAAYTGGLDTINSFTMYLYSDQTGSIKLENVGVSGYASSSQAVNANGYIGNVTKHRFTLGFKGANNVSASLGVEYMLVPGKRYLDARYSVYSAGAALTGVRTYLVMEPISGPLGTLVETAPVSDWQSINDLQSNWYAKNQLWPISNRVLTAHNVGFVARVPGQVDDWMGNTKAEVLNQVTHGTGFNPTGFPWEAIVQPGAGVDGALAMRFPNSMSSIPTVNVKPQYTVEARLEVVPEPCTMALMLSGLAGLGAMRRRKK